MQGVVHLCSFVLQSVLDAKGWYWFKEKILVQCILIAFSPTYLCKISSCSAPNPEVTSWKQKGYPGEGYCCAWPLLKLSPQHHQRPSLGYVGSLFWGGRSVLGIQLFLWGNRWIITGCFYEVSCGFFFLVPRCFRMCRDCTEWCIRLENVLKPSFKGFFETMFCIILNSSGPNYEAMKCQPTFESNREKVFFSQCIMRSLMRYSKELRLLTPPMWS